VTHSGPPEARGIFIYGSKGWMKVANDKAEVYFGRKNDPGPVLTADAAPPDAELDADGQAHFENFIAAVRSRESNTLHAPLEDGHLSSSLCHLANISYRLGRSLTFDDARERFVEDEEADGYLSRTYRGAYSLPS